MRTYDSPRKWMVGPLLRRLLWACAMTAASDNPTQYESSLRKRRPVIRFLKLSWVRIVIPFVMKNFHGPAL